MNEEFSGDPTKLLNLVKITANEFRKEHRHIFGNNVNSAEAVENKYVQDYKRKGPHPRWEGKPAGTSWTGKTCWL